MPQNKISGIYYIQNIINNKMYIGQSINIYHRFYQHRNSLRNNAHDNEFLQNEWIAYGESAFDFGIIEVCNDNKLDEREIYFIDLYNTTDKFLGYNMTHGGKNNIKPISYVNKKNR